MELMKSLRNLSGILSRPTELDLILEIASKTSRGVTLEKAKPVLEKNPSDSSLSDEQTV
jgi:hypothetical protein